VTATGTGPFIYQWYKGGNGDTTNPIAGANASTHSITGINFDRSSYWVRVQDACGAHADSNAVRVVLTDKRPLIFVPGISGSVLVEEGNRELWPGPIAFLPVCAFGNLTLDPSEPSHTIFASDVVRSFEISLPGVTLYRYHVYDSLLAKLVDDGGYRTGQNETLFLVPYDWRKTNKSDGGTAGLLQSKINLVKSLFPGMNIDVLAHSMGGIVAQRYIMDNRSIHHINKVVTIGTPWLGAPKAINVWRQAKGSYPCHNVFQLSRSLRDGSLESTS